MSSTIKKYQVNNHTYTFICRSRSTRNGFAHDVELFYENNLPSGFYEHCLGTATCHYLNRTWERYTYQTVMMSVIRNKIDKLTEIATHQFKELSGVSRITAKRKAELEKYIDNQRKGMTLWIELEQLYEMIK